MSVAEPVRLTEGQVAASGAVLARAMANDPVFTYMLSDPVERERLMLPLGVGWTRYGLLFGEGVRDRRAGRGERRLAAAGRCEPDHRAQRAGGVDRGCQQVQ